MKVTKIMKFSYVLVLFFCILLIPARVWADTVSIGAEKDNTVYEEDGSLSNGAGDYFFTGVTKDNWRRHGLIQFDVASAIPADSTISSVTLTLYMSRTRTQDMNIDLHRVTSDWGEAASHASGEEGAGTSAEVGDATWTYRFWETTAWTNSGGDYNSTVSGTAVVGNQTGFYSWSTAGMAADVQAWLDTPATNYGWIVIGITTETRQAKRFESRDTNDTNRRPVLEITFTPPAQTGACCALDGTCTVTDSASCSGTYQGDGAVCSPNPCPQPQGACCYPDEFATCVEETEASCTGAGGTWQGALSVCTPNPCPVVLTPFVDSLPLPAVAQPTSGVSGGAADYTITMRQITQQLHRDLPPTTVWGYDDGTTGGTYPGSTIEAWTDLPVTVTWANDLRDNSGNLLTDHYLPVDECPHGVEDASPRTVVHLHGGHIAAEFDGYPESTFLPGQQVVYEYPNWQDAATLWYHDHALGITRLNVYMGLAGIYLIRDANELSLGLPSGEFEVPLVIQDRTFNPDGSLQYPALWQEHFFGDTILVNGKVWPFLNVKQGKYRFRLLNGSNSRVYHLTLSNGASFQAIGTDGGLISAPVTVNDVLIPPGERADIVIDFESYAPGTEILLVNDAPAPYPGVPGVGVIPDIMKFVVEGQPGHTVALPSNLRTLEILQETDAVISRDFELEKAGDPCTGGNLWLINGLGWNDITELPQLGNTEIWRFINKSGVTHPMHMHLVFFQILDIQPGEVVGGVWSPTGPAVPPPPEEVGWKDTVKVEPLNAVRVIARFEDFVGKYPYHCHILEHEDHEMMRQFQTTTTCGDGFRGLPVEECDDGNTTPGDGCSSICLLEDADGDGIHDDGDISGIIGDNPCTGGNKIDCDDNCVGTQNPDQADVDNDGIGDVCDPCTDVDGDGLAIEGGVCGLVDCDDTDANIFPGGPGVRVMNPPIEYYFSVQTGYNNADNLENIQIKAETFTENLLFDQNKAVTFEGGYDCAYVSITGTTTVIGNITLNNGSITILGGSLTIQ
ncbi:MAG: multicopper oxidase domain-containing protein [Planctomycetota bacterium]|jgi:spore coat protein A